MHRNKLYFHVYNHQLVIEMDAGNKILITKPFIVLRNSNKKILKGKDFNKKIKRRKRVE